MVKREEQEKAKVCLTVEEEIEILNPVLLEDLEEEKEKDKVKEEIGGKKDDR